MSFRKNDGITSLEQEPEQSHSDRVHFSYPTALECMVELGGSGNDTTHAQVSGAFHRSEERKMPGTHESTTLSFARFMDRSMAQKRDASYFLPKQRGRGAAGVKRAASAGAHRFLFFFSIPTKGTGAEQEPVGV